VHGIAQFKPFDQNMTRSFFATLTAYFVGVVCLGLGMSLLVFLLGDQLTYSVRRAHFPGVFGFVVVIAGGVGGLLSAIFWIVFAWPLHARLLRVQFVRDNLLVLGASAGLALGICSAAMIGFWGGIAVTVLFGICGVLSGITFCMMIRHEK